MAQCSQCKTETELTELYDAGIPVCVTCSNECDEGDDGPEKDQWIRTFLLEDLLETSHLAQSALVAPETSASLNMSREALAQAHNRLNDYLSRGTVPEDLKRSGRI
jgi:hypothetical protein